MKKYNMPTMEISLFDVEVVSTGETSKQSADMATFNDEMKTIASGGGVTKTISWNELKWTY